MDRAAQSVSASCERPHTHAAAGSRWRRAAVRDEHRPAVTAQDGRRLVAITHDVYESARTGRAFKLAG